MSQADFSEEELVEVTLQASAGLASPPPALGFGEAVRNAIFQQPWTVQYPSTAEELCNYIANDSFLLDLISKYPTQASWTDLTNRIRVLINEFPGFATLSEQLKALQVANLDEFWEEYDRILREQWGDAPAPIEDYNLLSTSLRPNNPDIQIIELQYMEHEIPLEAALTDLINIIAGVVPEYPPHHPGDVFNMGEFLKNLPDLYAVFMWQPTKAQEQAAIKRLRTSLEKLPKTISIGGVQTPTPFINDYFWPFLESMESRNGRLQELYDSYFGSPEGESFFDWLNEQVEDSWYAKIVGFALNFGVDVTTFVLDKSEPVVEELWGDDVANWYRNATYDTLTFGLTTGYSIFKLGSDFQWAIETEPLSALAGVAWGMVGGSPIGLFFDTLIAAWQYSIELNNQLTGGNLEIPSVVLNWRNPFGQNDAFTAGVNIGQFGMAVADLVVGVRGVPTGSIPGIKALNAGGGEAVVEATATVILPVAVVQDLGIAAAGLTTYHPMSRGDDTPDDDDESSSDVYHPDYERGLGDLAGQQARVTEEELAIIRRHLDRMDPAEYNNRMLERLENALEQGEMISGGDLSFYRHELAEAEIMDNFLARNPTLSECLTEYPADILARYPDDIERLNSIDPNMRLSDLPEDLRNAVTYWYSHNKALDQYNVSQFSVYPREIYEEYGFNELYQNFWNWLENQG